MYIYLHVLRLYNKLETCIYFLADFSSHNLAHSPALAKKMELMKKGTMHHSVKISKIVSWSDQTKTAFDFHFLDAPGFIDCMCKKKGRWYRGWFGASFSRTLYDTFSRNASHLVSFVYFRSVQQKKVWFFCCCFFAASVNLTICSKSWDAAASPKGNCCRGLATARDLDPSPSARPSRLHALRTYDK